MPLEKSEAIVLKAFNWSESSRTVVFFTRDFGKLALVDKGGRRITSKRGRLLQFTRMELTFYSSKKATSGYISDMEVLEEFSFEKDGTLGRLAYGSAACELLYLLLPEEQTQSGLYQYCLSFLDKVANIDKQYLSAIFIAFYLRVMSQLGYRPSLAFCADCEKDLEKAATGQTQLFFSPERGGLICRTCQRAGERYIPVSVDGARLLAALQRASLDEAASLPIGYKDATLLIDVLTQFLQHHSGLVSDLKSVAFLEKLKRSHLND